MAEVKSLLAGILDAAATIAISAFIIWLVIGDVSTSTLALAIGITALIRFHTHGARP